MCCLFILRKKDTKYSTRQLLVFVVCGGRPQWRARLPARGGWCRLLRFPTKQNLMDRVAGRDTNKALRGQRQLVPQCLKGGVGIKHTTAGWFYQNDRWTKGLDPETRGIVWNLEQKTNMSNTLDSDRKHRKPTQPAEQENCSPLISSPSRPTAASWGRTSQVDPAAPGDPGPGSGERSVHIRTLENPEHLPPKRQQI